MKVYIPSNQAEKYKAIEEEADKAEFMAMAEQLSPRARRRLLYQMKWIIVKRKIKQLLGLQK